MSKGMTKVSVLYANGSGKTFDMEYYLNTHIPLVKKLLAEALKGISVEQGMGGGAPGSIAPFAGIANMYFESPRDFGKAFGPHANEILADVPNFTNIEPLVQVSEVLL